MLGIKVLSLERLHHTAEQFVMASQIVEEIWKVLQAALFSRTALFDGFDCSVHQCAMRVSIWTFRPEVVPISPAPLWAFRR